MRFALMIEPQQGLTYEDQLAIARRAEAAGFESLFRSDHYAELPGHRPASRRPTPGRSSPASPARRRASGSGTLVSPVTFRHPGNFAKVATTVDEMSGGRLEVGVGAGWNDDEHQQLGLPFPQIEDRADLLEEQLAVLHGLWEEPDGWSFEGTTVRIQDALFHPKPVEPAGPADRRERRVAAADPHRRRGLAASLRIAARYADEFNLSSSSPETAREKFAELDAACEAIGRDPKTLTRSAMVGVLIGRDDAEVDRAQAAICSRPSATSDGRRGLARRRRERAGSSARPTRPGRWSPTSPRPGSERIMLQDFLPRDLEMIDLMARSCRGV